MGQKGNNFVEYALMLALVVGIGWGLLGSYAQNHAPSQVLQIKSRLIYNIKHQTKYQHDQSGKQHGAGD